MRRWLLIVTGGGATLIRWRLGRWVYSRDLGDPDALAEALAGEAGAECRLLVERPEEEFGVEWLPRLRGVDRRRLLARHARRLFGEVVHTRGRTLERAGGRERLRFSALSDEAPLRPWREALARAGVEVTGVLSPTLLLPRLLARLGVAAGDRLVVVALREAGVRLVLLVGGRVVGARLLPPFDEGVSAQVWREVAATEGYWRGRGLWPPEEPERLLIGGGEAPEDVRRLALPEGTPWADGLFAAVAMAPWISDHYGGPAVRRAAWRSATRRTVALGAPWWLLAALLIGGRWAWLAGELERETSALEARTAALARRPPSAGGEASPERMAALVERAEALAAAAPWPEPVLRALGRVLEGWPEVTLERLRWVVSDDPGRWPDEDRGVAGRWLLLRLELSREEEGGDMESLAPLVQKLREMPGWERVTLAPRLPADGVLEGVAGVPDGGIGRRFLLEAAVRPREAR